MLTPLKALGSMGGAQLSEVSYEEPAGKERCFGVIYIRDRCVSRAGLIWSMFAIPGGELGAEGRGESTCSLAYHVLPAY